MTPILPPNSVVVATTAILGIANHLYFKRYEPVRTTVVRTACFLLLEPAIQLFALHRFAGTVDISKSNLFITYLIFFGTMATFITLYRLSPFHPLAKIPGPVMYKITKFYRMYVTWTGQQRITLNALHDQYGPIIHTGPNEISTIDLDPVKPILGTGGLPKAHVPYLFTKVVGHPAALIGTTGEKRIDRRRIWNRGFTSESIKEYQQSILTKANELAEGLSTRAGVELDLFQWMSFFTFEMMFGANTNMLKNGKDHQNLMKLIQNGNKFDEITSHVPWITCLATFLPSDNAKLRQFASGWGNRRLREGAEKKDLWYHLTDEEGHEKIKPTPFVVDADSQLAIIAGSDTTSSALTNVIWCLLAHPNAYKRARDEVDREFPPGTDPLLDTSRYSNLKFTKACL
ncbi:hypothetical protein PQX77_021789 [Marasmius sp. AFHP31]|nr:hypothetical protein PQX77_021789 [Marasmius sp. AFHP31]